MGKKRRKKTVANQLEDIVSLLCFFIFFSFFFPPFVFSKRLPSFKAAYVYQSRTFSYAVGDCLVLVGGFLSLTLDIDELLR